MPLISSKRINKNNKNVVILKKNKSSRVPLGVLGAGWGSCAPHHQIIRSQVPVEKFTSNEIKTDISGWRCVCFRAQPRLCTVETVSAREANSNPQKL